MRTRGALSLAALFLTCALDSCTSLSDTPDRLPDPQTLKILFQYGFRDELNTFDGTLRKDLVLDGTVTIPFWLSAAEQDTILRRAMAVGFYSFPDTVRAEEGVHFDPDPSPDMLRLEHQGMEKTVVWYYRPSSGSREPLLELSGLIRGIIQSKPEYKSLPPARGGYI